MPAASASLTPGQFVEKCKGRGLTERSGSQTHFIDLCRMLDVPAPYDDRADDANYCFDALTAAAGSHLFSGTIKKPPRLKKRDDPALFGGSPPATGAAPASGGGAEGGSPPSASAIIPAPQEGRGFADVWKRGHFCWEYKRQGKHADLGLALRQLKEYKDSLDNPPLLIVCDVDTFEVHTNFTGHPAALHRFTLEDLADTPQEWRDKGISPLAALRYAFTNPEWFRPKARVTDITEEFAAQIGELARAIADRGNDPHDTAHFLMQVVFALFAEDVGLLPPDLVTKVIGANTSDGERFKRQMRLLFRAMESGGDFGADGIEHFNGGLFRNLDTQTISDLAPTEIGLLSIVAQQDWSAVEPSILGTLFERSLNPGKRAQIGATTPAATTSCSSSSRW